MAENIDVEESQGVICVLFRENSILDEANIRAIGEDLMELTEIHSEIKLLLNFDGVNYLSSGMLGKLIALHKKVKSDKGKLRLCSIKPQIFDVFSVTKLDRVLDIHPDKESAMSAFGCA